MRILIVSNFYPPFAVGGAEIVAHRHAQALIARGHEVVVFAGRPQRDGKVGGEIDFEIVDGVEVHGITLRSLNPDRSFRWDAAGRAFRAVALRTRPDIVHFHNLSGLGANLVLEAKRLGLRTICTVHDHWAYCVRNTLQRPEGWVCRNTEECNFCVPNVTDDSGKALPFRLPRDYMRACMAQPDILVFPSAYLADAYRAQGFDPARIRVQSNGIEIARFAAQSRTDDGPLRIAVVGYLGEHKGFRLLFEALDLLLAQPRLSGKWHVEIAGDGHMRDWIASRCEETLMAEHVSFLGRIPQDDVPKLMAQAEVVLLPSIWPENEPVVMLEAIAAGAAQLASRIGGHVDLVDEDRSGLLFESGDAQDLAARLAIYIDDPERARAHGAYNLSRRDAFAQEASVSAYEAMYRAAPADNDGDEAIILCDGGWPSQEVAQFFNNFASFERNLRIRFIYADWADDSLWARARALFLWSDERRTPLVARALRAGLPIVAPADTPTAIYGAREGGAVIPYASFAEAIATLTGIAESGAPLRLPKPDLADLALALARPEAFALSSEHPAI